MIFPFLFINSESVNGEMPNIRTNLKRRDKLPHEYL
jgi:hypothetical protein